MSGKALLPGFGDDEEGTESQITQTVAEVSQLFKEAQLKMKLMGSKQGDDGQGDEVMHFLPSPPHTLSVHCSGAPPICVLNARAPCAAPSYRSRR